MLSRIVLIVSLLLSSCRIAREDLIPFEVQVHPEGRLFAGDFVSFEVIPDSTWDSNGKQIKVSLEGSELGVQSFSRTGIGQRVEAIFWWIWKTSELKDGEYEVTFSILPEGPTWSERIYLYPEENNPDSSAKWMTEKTECCLLHYISGTDADRDIDLLSVLIDDLADLVESQLNTQILTPINITIIPKLIGQGGFASNGIYVTYNDGNITGNQTTQVIQHEMVHILDDSLGKGAKPPMLVEGLAVFLSNGHYKKEELLIRAASLLDMDEYIPFKLLLKDFYSQQHEISYLEAGALVEYLVDTYGWDSFREFYSGIDLNGGSDGSLEANLEKTFDIDLLELEQDYILLLQSQKIDELVRSDLMLTIDLYDSVRLFQQKLEPGAYYATAWLPDVTAMQEKGIVADFIRSKEGLDVWLIKSLIRSASNEITAGDFLPAQWILNVTGILLAVYP